MSPDLPFDIITLIIDIVGENKDRNLLKELALVSHSFLQICSKHLYATVELHDSSKRGFIKLLKSRPDVVKHIRDLLYHVGYNINDDDHQLSLVLLKFLPTFSRLNSLTIIASYQNWTTLNSSLKSAFLHLMHLPTINHIDLSFIQDFQLSSLTLSVNLHRLDIFHVKCLRPLEENSPEILMEMMPKIREFHTINSSLVTTKLLLARTQDGRPAFNLMDLRRVTMSFNVSEDERNIRHILRNAKLLEKIDLSVFGTRSLVGILSLSPLTLKVLRLSVDLHNREPVPLGGRLGGLCEELEALAGHNMLEALSFALTVDGNETEDSIGYVMQKVEKVLVKPASGWSALKQVSFHVSIGPLGNSAKLCEALQSLPDKYLSHFSKLESIAFNYSAYFL